MTITSQIWSVFTLSIILFRLRVRFRHRIDDADERQAEPYPTVR